MNSYKEFKQTRKLVCRGVTAAKYIPAKGYSSLIFLLGSTNYVTRAVSNMVYIVGQTSRVTNSQSQTRDSGRLCTREKKTHLPTILWLQFRKRKGMQVSLLYYSVFPHHRFHFSVLLSAAVESCRLNSPLH